MIARRPGRFGLLGALAISAAACGSRGSTPDSEPESEELVGTGNEAELATVRVTPEAEKRLGIQTAKVERKSVARTRQLPGLVETAPGEGANIAAPVAGLLVARSTGPLLPGKKVERGEVLLNLRPLVTAEPDLVARAQRDVAAARAQAHAASAKAARVEALVSEGAESERGAEEAAAAAQVAEADLAEADKRLTRARQNPFAADVAIPLRAPEAGTVLRLSASPGQIVTAGAPLVDIARVERAWIRATVYVGDLDVIDRSAPAYVTKLGNHDRAAARAATPVDAPALGDPKAATAEIVYAIDNADAAFLPGQRVMVSAPLAQVSDSLVVPWSALLYDIHGGAWVYEQTAPHVYSRRRVEVRDIQGEVAVLQRGPEAGAAVVSTGAAELYGSEFGASE